MDGFTIIGLLVLFLFSFSFGTTAGDLANYLPTILRPVLTSRRVKRWWNKHWPAFFKVKKPLRDILPAFPNLGPPFSKFWKCFPNLG
jgi:hypothetical protein